MDEMRRTENDQRIRPVPRGFTLIELMVVMAILAILAAVSIPSYISWKPSYRLRQAANDLLSDFQTVRATAIKRNVQCSVSLEIDGGDVTGYVAYVDAEGDFSFDGGEEVLLRSQFSKYGYVSCVGDDFLDGGGQPTLAFRFDGIPVSTSGGTDFPNGGILTLENTRGKIANLNVSIAGAIWLD